MSDDALRDRFRELMRTDVKDPWEDARKFIASYFGIGDTREQIEDYARNKGYSPADIRGLKAIDMLLASPDCDDQLVQMVLWVANEPLPVADGAHARMAARGAGLDGAFAGILPGRVAASITPDPLQQVNG